MEADANEGCDEDESAEMEDAEVDVDEERAIGGCAVVSVGA